MSFSDDPFDDVDGRENERTWVLVTHGLYAASLFVAFPALVGVVLAYVRRGEAPEWARTHYTYAIHTFWISFWLTCLGLLTLVVLIGLPILGLVWLWFLVRCVIALVRAIDGREMENPKSWLF